jgi:YD repeat-containing protein
MQLTASPILLAMAVLAACGGEGDDVRRPARRVSHEVEWQTPFGSGGATIPELPGAPETGGGAGGLSRLEGAVFPSKREILFFGSHEPGESLLDPNALLDAFAISLRAVSTGQAPGVSIEPLPEQLARGIRDGDPMQVLYIGGDRGTKVGYTAFEADRTMKSLSLGRDNVSKAAVTSGVTGFRSQLDMAHLDALSDRSEWHRFWLTPLASSVESTTDGLAIAVDSTLMVEVRPMAVGPSGRLADLEGVPASPSATAFAEHMTRHYLEFAREFEAFRELQVIAQLVGLAEAVKPPERPDSRTRPELDLEWLLDQHLVAEVPTPKTTPAAVAHREDTLGSGTTVEVHTYQVTGGVDLSPRNQYRSARRRTERLRDAIFDEVEREPRRLHWRVGLGDELIDVVRPRIDQELKLWQTDLVLGPLGVVRELSELPGQRVGRGWRIRLPEAALAGEVVSFADVGEAPPAARVVGLDGRSVWLGHFGRTRLPGKPEAPSYLGEGAEQLVLLENAWLFFDGDVPFVTRDGQSFEPQIPSGRHVIEFEAEGLHRPVRVRTSTTTIEYQYRGDALIRVADTQGRSIDLDWRPDGRLLSLHGSDGSVREYRYESDGALRAVVDKAGKAVSYTHGPQRGAPVGELEAMSAELAGGPASRARFLIESSPPWEETLEHARGNTDDRVAYVAVREAPAGSSTAYEIGVGGKPLSGAGALFEDLRAKLHSGGGHGTHSRALVDRIREADEVRRRPELVVLGPANLREELAAALRVEEGEKRVTSSSDAQMAAANLARPVEPGFRVISIDRIGAADTPDGSPQPGALPGTVVIAGYTSAALEEAVSTLGQRGQLRDKVVVLLTSGETGAPGLPGRMREEFGVLRVINPREPIAVRQLEAVASGLARELDRSPPGEDIWRPLRRVIERTRRLQPDSIPRLEMWKDQVRRGPDPNEVGTRAVRAGPSDWSQDLAASRQPGPHSESLENVRARFRIDVPLHRGVSTGPFLV